MDRTALIAGVTGIVGNNLARQLLDTGWKVAGLARQPSDLPDGVSPVAADLLDPDGLRTALEPIKPTHVFYGSCCASRSRRRTSASMAG